MADSIEIWTGVVQNYRDQLAELLTALTIHRQNLDDFWDVLWACRDLRLDSRAMIASSTRVSRNPVWGIVSAQLRRVYENTPDPTDDTMQRTLRTLTNLVRNCEHLASFYRARVQASEEVLQELIASQEANPV